MLRPRVLEPWQAQDSLAARLLKTARDVLFVGALGWLIGLAAALTVVLVLGALTGCTAKLSSVEQPIVLVAPLPSALTKYVPAVYDDTGAPVGAADSSAGPVLWLWPSGLVNVAGVSLSSYYPLHAVFTSSPKGSYDLRVNMRAQTPLGVSAGWQVTGTDFAVNDSSRSALPGFTDADVPVAQLLGARVDVVAVTDSVLELEAQVFYQAGAELDTARTYARLVHENFRRP